MSHAAFCCCCFSERMTVSFYSALFNIYRSGILTALFGCCIAGATWNCCLICACSVYIPYNNEPVHGVMSFKSHIVMVHACLVVNCHLQFWQNGRVLLRATAVTRRWNWYRNKSQHRKLTLEKKIHTSLLLGIESATFRSRIRRSNHWAIAAARTAIVPTVTYMQICIQNDWFRYKSASIAVSKTRSYALAAIV